jgi:glutamine---fructose-6-phosphate transaminase (isomerizing)
MKSLSLSQAIALQPEILERGRQQMARSVMHLGEGGGLSGVVALAGMGASYAAAIAALPYYRRLGIRAFGVESSELWREKAGLADSLVFISASGRSVETLEAARQVSEVGRSSAVAVTAEQPGQLASYVDARLVSGVDGDSSPRTASFTAALQTLALLAATGCGRDALTQTEADWAAVPDAIVSLLGQRDQIASAAAVLQAVSVVDVVGHSVSLGIAAEMALLLREGPRIASAWFDSRAYLHGPMESLEPGRALIAIGDEHDDGIGAALSQARAIGCPVVSITASPVHDLAANRVIYKRPADLMAGAVLQVVAAQLITHYLLEVKGLTSGSFRYDQPQTRV